MKRFAAVNVFAQFPVDFIVAKRVENFYVSMIFVEFNAIKVKASQHFLMVHNVSVADEKDDDQKEQRNKRFDFQVAGNVLFAADHRWEILQRERSYFIEILKKKKYKENFKPAFSLSRGWPAN